MDEEPAQYQGFDLPCWMRPEARQLIAGGRADIDWETGLDRHGREVNQAEYGDRLQRAAWLAMAHRARQRLPSRSVPLAIRAVRSRVPRFREHRPVRRPSRQRSSAGDDDGGAGHGRRWSA